VDNCEHAAAGVAALASRLLQRCPNISLLAMSRAPLGITGESVVPLGPLPVEGAAVELFAERARSADDRFRLTDDQLGPVTDLCAALDGLPLAIELAAARIGALGPEQIAARIGQDLSALSSRDSAWMAIQRHDQHLRDAHMLAPKVDPAPDADVVGRIIAWSGRVPLGGRFSSPGAS